MNISALRKNRGVYRNAKLLLTYVEAVVIERVLRQNLGGGSLDAVVSGHHQRVSV